MTDNAQQYQFRRQSGPYENFVISLTQHYPVLRHLSGFLQQSTDSSLSRMTVLNFLRTGSVSQNPISRPEDLQVLMPSHSAPDIVGHVLLVEDLTSTSIEILGHNFGIDPLFFAYHLREPRIGLGGGCRITSGLPRMLPSDAKRVEYFMIEYEQSLVFGSSHIAFPKPLKCQSNVLRKVGLIRMTEPHEFVGHARRCFSVLKVKRENQRWLFIILLDPPVGNKFFLDYEDSCTTPIPHYYPGTSHLRGGYTHIPEILTCSSQVDTGPKCISLMDDMVYFWTSQQLPFHFNISDPDIFSISYFGLRMVASEWWCFLSLTQGAVETFETSLEYERPEENDHRRIENNLANLQKMKRRFNTFRENLDATLGIFKSHLYRDADHEFVSAMEEDFREISARLSISQQRVEGVLPVVTALVQILDGRRSYQETTNLTRLTYLALIFVPLNFCSSLFSMGGKIAPGGSEFWVYFVVALPLLVLTFGVVMVRPRMRVMAGLM
ncbi:hypothetical protein BDD12DRAFT_782107 [Trichophaea hybrida]|nr:hypothetical protein BDD12DRAFT_782107 [Trichophaea hybrida]